jgi:A/G-specific adenine glycosylase
VASFAFGQRHAVLDTNVRRVLARLLDGVEHPPPSPTRAERERAAGVLPEGSAAPRWSVGVMELGALVCTATSPGCGRCPVAELCAWRAAGSPPYDGPPRRAQTYAGTDRQCRGRLLAVLREADGPVHVSRLEATWTIDDQRRRCLDSLVEDGLVAPVAERMYALP